MDKFITWSDNGGLVQSSFDATNLPEGKLAQQFTLCDNFFHSAFGGSFLNHMWLIAAASPVWKNAPKQYLSQPDPKKPNFKDGQVTPDGYAVNTSYSINQPHPEKIKDTTLLMPSQTLPTIGDRLNDGKVSWAWYSGGWDDAIHGKPNELFQYHHQPFVYFKNFKDGSANKKEHLKDEDDFIAAVQNGTLPSVSFVKPLGNNNEHPGYASLAQGQQHVDSLVQLVMKSKYWKNTIIIIAYDENGGRWDHVAPPKIDRWGPGTRVPCIVISPFAREHFIDHTQYETVSILKLIETRYQLKPLNNRDATAKNMLNAFDFEK
jgi:phospholipase C